MKNRFPSGFGLIDDNVQPEIIEINLSKSENNQSFEQNKPKNL